MGVCIHGDRPHYSKAMCRSCYEKDLRQRNPEYAERQRQNTKGWLARPGNHERKKAIDRARPSDPVASRRSLLRQYGLTEDDYQDLLVEQGGVCAICRREPGRRKLAVDHDHTTGEVRGLLCFRCNFGLSWFAEDMDRLARAADYVRGRAIRWEEGAEASAI